MPSGWPWLLALLYAIGLVVWLDRTAFVLRLSGWVLMAAALVVPLTLTPVLPVVAAMVVPASRLDGVPSVYRWGHPRTAVRGALRASAVTSGSEQPGECPEEGRGQPAVQEAGEGSSLRPAAREPPGSCREAVVARTNLTSRVELAAIAHQV